MKESSHHHFMKSLDLKKNETDIFFCDIVYVCEEGDVFFLFFFFLFVELERDTEGFVLYRAV